MVNNERKIKKDFWTDEKISKVCIQARLLYIGLWSMADDYGVLRGITLLIRNRVFPYDDIETRDVDLWLDALIDIGRLEPFTFNGESFLYIKNFIRHQGEVKGKKTDMPKAPITKSKSTKKVNEKEKKEDKKTVKRQKKKKHKAPKPSIDKPSGEPKEENKLKEYCNTVDDIYNYYLSKISPRGGVKGEKDAKNFIRMALITYENDELKASIDNYLKTVEKTTPQFRRTCGNFFSTMHKYFQFYLPKNYPPKGKIPSRVVEDGIPPRARKRKIIREMKPKDPFKKGRF